MKVENRIYKFRAWDKEKKEWIEGETGTTFTSIEATEGQLAISLDGHLRVFSSSCYDPNPEIEDDKPMHGISNSEYESTHPCHTKPTYKRQYVLMQYTGLKAKGKEIYEGDIVRVDGFKNSPQFFSIVYDAPRFIMKRIGKGGDRGFYLYQSEVIGNIYENKELLKAQVVSKMETNA